MLTTKIKLLVDFPGQPAGSILVKTTDNNVYLAETDPNFWMAPSLVENDLTKFAIETVVHQDGVTTKQIFDAAVDATVVAQTELTNRIAALQTDMTTMNATLAAATPAVRVGV